MQKQISQEVNKLLQKKMDRKGFLKHVAVGFVAMTGVAGLVKTLTGVNGTQQSTTTGYGSSVYGGAKPQQSNKSV